MRRAVIVTLFVVAWLVGPVAVVHDEPLPAPNVSPPTASSPAEESP